MKYRYTMVDRDSSVSIATRYELEGPRIESRWGRDFQHSSRPALGPASCTMGTGGKTAGSWRWPPTPSSAEVEEIVELCLYSPSGPSWPVLGWSLPLQINDAVSDKNVCGKLLHGVPSETADRDIILHPAENLCKLQVCDFLKSCEGSDKETYSSSMKIATLWLSKELWGQC
jgi:hypothetical protein